MGQFSLSHLLILILLGILFFRPRQLPDLGKSLGKTIRNFKQSLNEIEVDAKDIHDDPDLLKARRVNPLEHKESNKKTEKT